MARAILLPVVAPPKPDVMLTLSPEEAKFLYDLFGRVGGNPEKSRRQFAQSIREALHTVGYNTCNLSDTNGSIYFLTPEGKEY